MPGEKAAYHRRKKLPSLNGYKRTNKWFAGWKPRVVSDGKLEYEGGLSISETELENVFQLTDPNSDACDAVKHWARCRRGASDWEEDGMQARFVSDEDFDTLAARHEIVAHKEAGPLCYSLFSVQS